MLELRERYSKRPIRFLETWQPDNWRIKVYSIAYQRNLAHPRVVALAKERFIPHLEEAKDHYHIGFLGVHEGRGANFIFLDYWTNENELIHLVYASSKENPAEMTYLTPDGLIACVWDLALVCFERQAWLEHVLANPNGPDLEAYLSARLNADI